MKWLYYLYYNPFLTDLPEQAIRQKTENTTKMKVLGVDFIPAWIPWKRRLQTLSVIFYVSMFMTLPIVFYVLAITLFFTRYYWISLGYLAWCIYDNYSLRVSTSVAWHLLRYWELDSAAAGVLIVFWLTFLLLESSRGTRVRWGSPVWIVTWAEVQLS